MFLSNLNVCISVVTGQSSESRPRFVSEAWSLFSHWNTTFVAYFKTQMNNIIFCLIYVYLILLTTGMYFKRILMLDLLTVWFCWHSSTLKLKHPLKIHDTVEYYSINLNWKGVVDTWTQKKCPNPCAEFLWFSKKLLWVTLHFVHLTIYFCWIIPTLFSLSLCFYIKMLRSLTSKYWREEKYLQFDLAI